MIISHRHKFIFIKTRKTAGTSMEIALSRFCGPKDVITPVTPEDEALRRESGGRGPQNFELHHQDFERFCQVLRRTPIDRAAETLQRDFSRGQRLRLFNHVSAACLRLVIPPEIWQEYFKFCFERNPWDKVISYYYFMERQEPREALNVFIRSGRAGEVSDFELYAEAGRPLVDFVGRYERLTEDWSEVCRQLRLPEVPELKFAKAGFRHDRRPYQELISPHDRQVIEVAFAREIALLGYRFEPHVVPALS